jgi:hypothetical protein
MCVCVGGGGGACVLCVCVCACECLRCVWVCVVRVCVWIFVNVRIEHPYRKNYSNQQAVFVLRFRYGSQVLVKESK